MKVLFLYICIIVLFFNFIMSIFFIYFNNKVNSEENLFDLFVKNEFEIFSKYFILCLVLSCLFALIPYFLNGRYYKENEKISEYECGFEPFDSATRQPFTIHFYIVGILFLIFDVEIALLFPWSVLFFLIDWYGTFIMFFFLFILTVAYIYEWNIGAIDWSNNS